MLFGDYVEPENSLKSLKAGLEHQNDPDFKMFETDIAATKDNVIVCGHDAYHKPLDRMFPHHEKLHGKKIHEVKYSQLTYCTLFNSMESMPTLWQVLEKLDQKVTKPVRIELKDIRNDLVTKNIIKQLSKFQKDNPTIIQKVKGIRYNINIHLMMRKTRFENVFKTTEKRDCFKQKMMDCNLILVVK